MGFEFTLPAVADGSGSCGELTGDDPYNVCSEALVMRKPEILTSVKKKAAQCGFTAILAPTEDISHSRLEDMGFGDDFTDFTADITRLTAESVSDRQKVFGVLSKSDPIASEYGENVFESAYFDHLEKITLMKDAGADIILLRNFEKLWDMRAGVLAAKNADIPVIVTIKVDDEGVNESDTDYIAALITLQALGAAAFGIECTCGAEETAELIKKAYPHAEIPLIAVADIDKLSDSDIEMLNENGAAMYIDTASCTDIKKIEKLLSFEPRFRYGEEKDSYAAAIFREAFFLPEYLEFSEPLRCDLDMSDEIIDFDDETINAIYIHLGSTDDAAYLADNAIMSRLPFIIRADDPTTLEAALRYYQGRLIVDTRCDIDEKTLSQLTKKYGALMY
ncbi:MAG: homocysteine S-methyltransferase family protein [Clostridia bacterium]|nr:homocysteine S-methyltransferase family protein [Clostridia bacterium]